MITNILKTLKPVAISLDVLLSYHDLDVKYCIYILFSLWHYCIQYIVKWKHTYLDYTYLSSDSVKTTLLFGLSRSSLNRKAPGGTSSGYMKTGLVQISCFCWEVKCGMGCLLDWSVSPMDLAASTKHLYITLKSIWNG